MASKYNLEQLGWFNFEQLVRTLLREILGAGLSTFSGSADQGRDATFFGKATSFPSAPEQWDGEWIIQVKHRVYTSRGAQATRTELKTSLADEILALVQKYAHHCNNYIFVTNCPLTSTDKDEMKAAVISSLPAAHIGILGESDLQELLDCNPKVVSAFPQILGLSQLRELVAWGLHQRSIAFLAAAQRDIATFVATTPYLNAIDLLHKQHFCVLSGPPKMGKTCTAFALSASFSALKYEVYDLRTQKDFYDAFRADAKQLFICDDVFGDISMHASMRDDWARGSIRLLGSLDHDHKLIWTAREYILKEALSSSRLKEERPCLETTDKVTVAVDKLTRLEKAMILYNHARTALLTEEVRSFLRSDACLKIVDHANYSPESVRQLCTSRLVSFSESAAKVSVVMMAMVLDFLAKPGDAWKTAYLAAPDGEKMLCTEVMASSGSILMSDLRQRYDSAVAASAMPLPSFEVSFTNARGTFLRSYPLVNGLEIVQFYHPSMRDLLVELIERDKAIRVAYLKQLKLREISSLARPLAASSGDASAKHRILIDDPDDVKLVKDQIDSVLLLSGTLADVMAVLSDVCATLLDKSTGIAPRLLRDSAQFSKVLWVILDCVLPHACSRDFWQANAERGALLHWRRLFETLRALLPYGAQTSTPTYVPELLRRQKNNISVDYWGLVQAAYSILPTVVEQTVALEEREECRDYIKSLVAAALTESKKVDLKSNCEHSQQWHAEHGSLPEDCDDYESLFPNDDPIERADDLRQVIHEYPRLEDEPDSDYSSDSRSSFSSDSNAAILEIFSDL